MDNQQQLASTIFKICATARKEGQIINADFIDQAINGLKSVPIFGSVDDEVWQFVKFEVQTNFDVDIAQPGVSLVNTTVDRWLDHHRTEIEWDYWNAYKQLMIDDLRSEDVINETDNITDEILDASGDPRIKGSWRRSGLVMGNVQSGKTQNYLGLINKSIDAGYKIIILLGGHLNELRRQTQERVDLGVIGKNSIHQEKLHADEKIGVGMFRGHRSVQAFTTTESDFSLKSSKSFRMNFHGVSDPIIFVIKKNAPVLRNLYKWISKEHDLDPENSRKLDMPMMLIDDEADYASINTKKEKNELTAINDGIRSLLSLFNRRTYIGYTATPFANIFIEPEDLKTAIVEDDLFPKDFMVRIPVPESYVGQDHFFKDVDEIGPSSPTILVEDQQTTIPDKANKTTQIFGLSESLKDAVRLFLISIAVRNIRGQGKLHCTMLVNVTHLTLLQNQVAYHISDYLKEMRHAVDYAFKYPLEEALLRSPDLVELKKTYDKHYSIEETFEQVYEKLGAAIYKAKSMAVHSSGEALDYSVYKENGLAAIVVGGHKLSRGLTLEGLTISYFTRNSKMYDTLMQMCRWFGYRPNYKDLCKVYITEESLEWYAFISEAINELYAELDRMAKLKKTPSEFGLKVRDYPGSLLVTARQKMNSAESYMRSIDFSGTRVRRFEFLTDNDVNERNLSVVREFVKDIYDFRTEAGKENKKILEHFAEVPYERILKFIDDMTMVDSETIPEGLVVDYIKGLERNGFPKFKVCIKQIQHDSDVKWKDRLTSGHALPSLVELHPSLEKVRPAKRLLNLTDAKECMRSPKSELGDPPDEQLLMPGYTFGEEYKSSGDDIAHPERDFPGMIIYMFSVGAMRKEDRKGEGKDVQVFHSNPTVGYTLSFPRPEHLKGVSNDELKRIVEKTKVLYVVNQVWKELTQYATVEEEEDDDDN